MESVPIYLMKKMEVILLDTLCLGGAFMAAKSLGTRVT